MKLMLYRSNAKLFVCSPTRIIENIVKHTPSKFLELVYDRFSILLLICVVDIVGVSEEN